MKYALGLYKCAQELLLVIKHESALSISLVIYLFGSRAFTKTNASYVVHFVIINKCNKNSNQKLEKTGFWLLFTN